MARHSRADEGVVAGRRRGRAHPGPGRRRHVSRAIRTGPSTAPESGAPRPRSGCRRDRSPAPRSGSASTRSPRCVRSTGSAGHRPCCRSASPSSPATRAALADDSRLPAACRTDLLTIGDSRSGCGFSARSDRPSIAPSSASSGAPDHSVPGPGVSIPAGRTLLETADGRSTGIDVDMLTLASAAGAGPGPTPWPSLRARGRHRRRPPPTGRGAPPTPPG